MKRAREEEISNNNKIGKKNAELALSLQDKEQIMAEFQALKEENKATIPDDTSDMSIAAMYGALKVMELLIDTGADFKSPVAGGKFKGATPLYLAAKNGHTKVVELLISREADFETPIYIPYIYGPHTPLAVAAQSGHYEVVELLISKKANFNTSSSTNANNDDSDDDEEQSPLYLAAKNGHTKVVELLINKGADFKTPTTHGDEDGQTPLAIAAEEGHDKAVELLITKGADVNSPASRAIGLTPLYLAARKGRDKVVELLITKGADVKNPPIYEDETADDKKQTPISIAANNGNIKVVELLINAGADFDISQEDGETPLYLAAKNGHYEVVELLINAGADINTHIVDGKYIGETPLSVAARHGRYEVVKLLINKGADLQEDNMLLPNTIKAFLQHTPSVSAQTLLFGSYSGVDAAKIMSQYLEIVKLLLINGVQIDNINEIPDTSIVKNLLLVAEVITDFIKGKYVDEDKLFSLETLFKNHQEFAVQIFKGILIKEGKPNDKYLASTFQKYSKIIGNDVLEQWQKMIADGKEVFQEVFDDLEGQLVQAYGIKPISYKLLRGEIDPNFAKESSKEAEFMAKNPQYKVRGTIYEELSKETVLNGVEKLPYLMQKHTSVLHAVQKLNAIILPRDLKITISSFIKDYEKLINDPHCQNELILHEENEQLKETNEQLKEKYQKLENEVIELKKQISPDNLMKLIQSLLPSNLINADAESNSAKLIGEHDEGHLDMAEY
ncbi:Ankyrin repeat-containing protein [Candidatus Megaera venefica]|uniref:Ankyrin repeat-containing protein n=1 Tax=Candidatus Megaera venefica TaxID=2055910 RepID=A0ABU5NAY7_9RICK|nr:ankyrin repeat domain-containing protein [Candidatus Megaera venefica]MEA0970343.1 Ankyrin repeat-containing protein [Candidatus Megaera venefica]